NLAVDYMDLSDFDKAFKYADSAQKVSDELAAGLDYNALGEILAYAPDSTLLKNGINPKTKDSLGISYLTSALKIAKQAGDLAVQRDAYNNLSTIYANMKNYSLSLDAYKNYITLRDSIINNAKRQQLISIEMQYDFDKKTDSLKFQQQITNSKLQQQIELEKSNLALSNKEKDLQKLAYLKTQSDLQNTELKESQKSKQLTIAQREQQLQQAKVKTLVQAASLNKLQLQQQWLYSIGALILIALTASWIIYNNRLRQHRLKTELAKEKAEQEKKEAEFQRNLADVSLTALRSQMNPHFIFNCLNSIKLYTAQNDTAAASEYLTKFSKLIRLVMENSRNDKIPLASELNALQLYIEMEAMRFKQKLKYNIHVDENAETDYIEIPPLLLQPYVENAIWHGLMHKEEGGKIDVGVSMTKDNSLLQITISDNGIGRAKSAELRSKTATKHKSYGMKVTSERIALINQIYKTGADVKVNDLFDEAGNAAGTKVTIQIPV
ncbi:MAG TPA: histidine kinase, partial [Parafilimonas sp.]|nr:histidine kinase [Parafilimonas sp.]